MKNLPKRMSVVILSFVLFTGTSFAAEKVPGQK